MTNDVVVNDRLESLILKSLLSRDSYARKVIPYLKDAWFEDVVDRKIFSEIRKFIQEYDALPTIEAITIKLSNDTRIQESTLIEAKKRLSEFSISEPIKVDEDWLVQETEKWAKDGAIYQAALKMTEALQDSKTPKGKILDYFNEALAVGFDSSIGHNYILDSEKRFDFYNLHEDKLPFDLKYMNKITKNGVPRKSLNLIMSSTGGGKSLAMCHFAAAYLMMSKNVLYITLEMSEERIAERIDANLLDIDINNIQGMSKEVFLKKMNDIGSKTHGKLIVKEYPTSSANASHFRSLLQELKLKKSFVPDVIFVDYLNIAASSRLGAMSQHVNSYTYVKSIAEEIRGLAVEFNVPIWTATQTTRSGSQTSDIGLEHTSECIWVEEKIELRDGTVKPIGELSLGDQIKANDDFKTVMMVHHKKIKPCYKIRLKSGKTIVVSEEHVFPTESGRISIKNGLKVGIKLSTKV